MARKKIPVKDTGAAETFQTFGEKAYDYLSARSKWILVYIAAFAVGLARGWAAAECTAFASAVAALSTTRLGGRAGLPDAAEAAALLARNGLSGPWEALADQQGRAQ